MQITYSYYIIKVYDHRHSTTYYKIGETKTTTRPQNLTSKYTAHTHYADVTAELLAMAELPHNNKKRLNDKRMHQQFAADSSLCAVNPLLIRGLYGSNEVDGANEFFTANIDNVVDYVAGVVAQLSANERNFTAKLRERIMLQYDKRQKHQVAEETLEELLQHSTEVVNKTLLFIGQFEPEQLVYLAGSNKKLYIWHDEGEQPYPYKTAKVIEKIQHITCLDELEDINVKFDLIISNPPYNNASDITRAVLDNVDFEEFVQLCPASKYKAKKLYKHVAEIHRTDDLFEDAAVGDSLTIAKLSKGSANRYLSDSIMLEAVAASIMLPFYRANMQREAIYEYIYMPKFDAALDPTRCFMVTMRTVQNGTHQVNGRGAADIRWNLELDTSNYPIDKTHGTHSSCFIKFATAEEKANFCNFWYSNNGDNLMNKLLKCMNQTSGKVCAAIPNVDWTRSWTDAEILAEFGYSEDEIEHILTTPVAILTKE